MLALFIRGKRKLAASLRPIQTPYFHEPNLIHGFIIKYMKSSESESIRRGYFNVERLSRSSRLAWPGISTLERLDSDAELFMYRT